MWKGFKSRSQSCWTTYPQSVCNCRTTFLGRESGLKLVKTTRGKIVAAMKVQSRRFVSLQTAGLKQRDKRDGAMDRVVIAPGRQRSYRYRCHKDQLHHKRAMRQERYDAVRRADSPYCGSIYVNCGPQSRIKKWRCRARRSHWRTWTEGGTERIRTEWTKIYRM